MASQRLDFRPATVGIYGRPGDDLTWRVVIADAGIVPGTVTVAVGGQTPTVDTSQSFTGTLIADITLTHTAAGHVYLGTRVADRLRTAWTSLPVHS